MQCSPKNANYHEVAGPTLFRLFKLQWCRVSSAFFCALIELDLHQTDVCFTVYGEHV